MPLYIVGDDITRMKVDAIVNPTDARYSGSGGADAAVHKAAGRPVSAAWRKLPPLSAGECVITDAGKLPCKKVIHTVGPVWDGGDQGEKDILCSCYSNALRLAKEAGLESIAMPLIGAGTFSCPQEVVYSAAKEVIRRFLETEEMEIFLLVYTKSALSMVMRECPDLVRYVQLKMDKGRKRESRLLSREIAAPSRPDENEFYGSLCQSLPVSARPKPRKVPAEKKIKCKRAPFHTVDNDFAPECDACLLPAEACLKAGSLSDIPEKAAGQDLDVLLKQLDIGFSEALIELLIRKNVSNVECYKRANIDRKHFSKICSDKNYHPAKKTVLALAVSLKLNRSETETLLKKAGYALSDSNAADVIVGFFIDKGDFDVFKINEVLFTYDQELLGNIPRDA